MKSEAKKLELIEKLLAVSDDTVLAAVDAALSKVEWPLRESFTNFSGKIGENDLAEIEMFIEQGCEQINPNDWK